MLTCDRGDQWRGVGKRNVVLGVRGRESRGGGG